MDQKDSNYFCEQCSKYFSTKTNLNKHNKTSKHKQQSDKYWSNHAKQCTNDFETYLKLNDIYIMMDDKKEKMKMYDLLGRLCMNNKKPGDDRLIKKYLK